MNKEVIKEFLKPDWKKFILPIILIVLFFVLINAFYTCGSVMNEIGCEMASLHEKLMHDVEQNNTNTRAFNQTVDKINVLTPKIPDCWEQVNKPILNFVKNIDPIIPMPCETNFLDGKICEFYINEDTYNCMTKMIKSMISADFLIEKPKIVSYRKYSVFNFGLNILILFLEGYLFSCLIIFVWNKFRKRKQ